MGDSRTPPRRSPVHNVKTDKDFQPAYRVLPISLTLLANCIYLYFNKLPDPILDFLG